MTGSRLSRHLHTIRPFDLTRPRINPVPLLLLNNFRFLPVSESCQAILKTSNRVRVSLLQDNCPKQNSEQSTARPQRDLDERPFSVRSPLTVQGFTLFSFCAGSPSPQYFGDRFYSPSPSLRKALSSFSPFPLIPPPFFLFLIAIFAL